MHLIGWRLALKLAEHAQLIFFARSPEEKWVHENISFRSVYNGQLQLCMYLLCGTVCTFWREIQLRLADLFLRYLDRGLKELFFSDKPRSPFT